MVPVCAPAGAGSGTGAAGPQHAVERSGDLTTVVSCYAAAVLAG